MRYSAIGIEYRVASCVGEALRFRQPVAQCFAHAGRHKEGIRRGVVSGRLEKLHESCVGEGSV